MSDLVSFVNKDGMVSSKVVAEKFSKRHKDVLKAIKNISKELSNDFYKRNFALHEIKGLRGSSLVSEVFMTRDGFAMVAMGFTGKEALRWKERFLEAFNQMEQAVLSEIPQLKATIARLHAEHKALPPARKTHHLTDTTLVPVYQMGMFGEEVVEFRRVPRNDDRFSELSRIEGRITHLSQCMEGMAASIKNLMAKAAKERRK